MKETLMTLENKYQNDTPILTTQPTHAVKVTVHHC